MAHATESARRLAADPAGLAASARVGMFVPSGLLEHGPETARAFLAHVEQADRLDHTKLLAFEQRLMRLADAVAARYFLQGPHAARAEKQIDFA